MKKLHVNVYFTKYMNKIWWNNGNELSLQYSGTNSLKSEILMFRISFDL